MYQPTLQLQATVLTCRADKEEMFAPKFGAKPAILSCIYGHFQSHELVCISLTTHQDSIVEVGEAGCRNVLSSTVIPVLQKGNWDMQDIQQGWGIYSFSAQPLPVHQHPHRKEFLPCI